MPSAERPVPLFERLAGSDEDVWDREADARSGSARVLGTEDSGRLQQTRRLVAVAGLAVFLSGSTLVVSRLTAGRGQRGGYLGPLAGRTVSLARDGCHTAKASDGDNCYKDVVWAMGDGIWGHPKYYEDTCPSLSTSSTFEEFQACVYKINQTTCPLPCNPVAYAAVSEENDATTSTATTTSAPRAADHTAPCHIALPGEECYTGVLRAMSTGIKANPEAFPGLTQSSSFEEFQAKLHKDPTSSCPRPCACHTAVEGEMCYTHVLWAKKTGIQGHPDWYHGISSDDSFEKLQMYFQQNARGSCGVPCTKVDLTKITQADLEVKDSGSVADMKDIEKELDLDHNFIQNIEKALQKHDPHPTVHQHPSELGCHTTVKGQTCYTDVIYGMTKGIHEHPEWYPKLTPSASFEEFQSVLHENPDLQCPLPCACHTAQLGDSCYDNIKWVLSQGLKAHPSWYRGITARSRFEEVQRRLLEDVNTTCKVPCTPTKWKTPSLFCFSVFRSKGYEFGLVKALLEKNRGIFACDQFAVLSDENLELSKGVRTLRIPPCETVGVSKDGTAANTLIFMQAWQVIRKDMRWAAHDFIIKADPDAVILPSRLRDQLERHTGLAVYVKNCMKWTGPGWPMMFGSLEAFSQAAIAAYFEGAEVCKEELEWNAWGEDLFMGNCLEHLGVGAVYEPHLSGDNVCKGADCSDGVSAAYHPFKSAEQWFECYAQATGDGEE